MELPDERIWFRFCSRFTFYLTQNKPPSKCPGERSDVHQGPSGLKTKSYFSSGEFTGVECTGTLDRGCQHCKLSQRVNKEHDIAECKSSF